MTAATLVADTAASHAAAARPRFDMYQPIHKGLRNFMADTLSRLGRVDVTDAEDLADALSQVESLLDFCAKHVQHENEFIHTAIRARQPAAASRTIDDHAEHLQSIDALHKETRAVYDADDAQRHGLALRLYRHLALFIAENLQHMHIEETANNAALWAHYTDEELVAIHDRLLASIGPADMMLGLRWMVPALTPQQRAGMLGEMKAGAPAEVFDAVVDMVRPHLAARDWSKLAGALA
ncbi:MAG TPA: hypothetical protein VGD46_07155 [Rhizobacter sp.]